MNSVNKVQSLDQSLFFRPAIMITIKPMMAMIRNDMRRLKIPATIPMSGGPTRKPRNPMLETAASAIPGDRREDFPASLYTSGTTEETPKPTMKNPMMEVSKNGKITATESPDAMS